MRRIMVFDEGVSMTRIAGVLWYIIGLVFLSTALMIVALLDGAFQSLILAVPVGLIGLVFTHVGVRTTRGTTQQELRKNAIGSLGLGVGALAFLFWLSGGKDGGLLLLSLEWMLPAVYYTLYVGPALLMIASPLAWRGQAVTAEDALGTRALGIISLAVLLGAVVVWTVGVADVPPPDSQARGGSSDMQRQSPELKRLQGSWYLGDPQDPLHALVVDGDKVTWHSSSSSHRSSDEHWAGVFDELSTPSFSNTGEPLRTEALILLTSPHQFKLKFVDGDYHSNDPFTYLFQDDQLYLVDWPYALFAIDDVNHINISWPSKTFWQPAGSFTRKEGVCKWAEEDKEPVEGACQIIERDGIQALVFDQYPRATLFYLSLDGRLLIEPELLRSKFNRGEFTINNSSHKRPD
jgi:hypothetical protein